MVVFCILSSGSFIDLTSYNILKPNIVLELLLFLFLFLSFPSYRFSFPALSILIISIIYVLYQFYIFKSTSQIGKLYDFLIIHKIFIYLSLLVCLGRIQIFTNNTVIWIYRILVIGMLVKYSLSHLLGIDDRPGFFTENNFEIMLLLFVFLSVVKIKHAFTFKDILLILIVLLLSGSRSGILAFASLFIFMDLTRYGITRFMKFIGGIVVLIASLGLFILRLDSMSVEDIDRFKFFLVFLKETSTWGIWEWVFGAPAITALSSESAKFFNYYYLLFSNHDEGVAFSLLFHSFILRMLFDHGFFGLLFVVFSTWFIMKKSGLEKTDLLGVISVLAVNSLSVSSLNSIYAILGILVLMSTSMNIVVDEKKLQASD